MRERVCMYVREGERLKQWFVHFLGVAKVSNKTETFIFAAKPKTQFRSSHRRCRSSNLTNSLTSINNSEELFSQPFYSEKVTSPLMQTR